MAEESGYYRLQLPAVLFCPIWGHAFLCLLYAKQLPSGALFSAYLTCDNTGAFADKSLMQQPILVAVNSTRERDACIVQRDTAQMSVSLRSRSASSAAAPILGHALPISLRNLEVPTFASALTQYHVNNLPNVEEPGQRRLKAAIILPGQ
ncbi:MAG: hypothetical protein FRX49_08752 [Trebouxia sp. A1-2]|nr:MAG: hypothetical protein FRX49_08752 [Trebouxia sp. A1-2]